MIWCFYVYIDIVFIDLTFQNGRYNVFEHFDSLLQCYSTYYRVLSSVFKKYIDSAMMEKGNEGIGRHRHLTAFML